MSGLTQTPSIHATYSLPATATATATAAAPYTSPPTSTSTSSSATSSHDHLLPPLPTHFTFPDSSSYSDSTLLRCEWSEHGYRMNVPHLTDLTVNIDTTGTETALVERVAAAGYRVTAESSSTDGSSGASRKLLQLTCHRVVLSTASRVLRMIIHGQRCLHIQHNTLHHSSARLVHCRLTPPRLACVCCQTAACVELRR